MKFDGSYKKYFNWVLNEFDAPKKTRYDLFTFQNTKYFAYRFNDFQSSIGKPLIKIRHSTVTDNYLAAEEIQNQNWQYFIERTIEACKTKEEMKPGEEFLLTTVENTTIAKKSYETFYNIAQKNLYLTIQKISVNEKNKITEDLKNKIFWYEHALTDLDSWIVFYYMFGRFPGAEKFTNLPNVNKPIFFTSRDASFTIGFI